MKLLLDSHAVLWFAAGDARLSVVARAVIEDAANANFVSMASLWELAIKASLGKLELRPDFAGFVQRAVTDNGFDTLHVEKRHLHCLLALAHHHRDPFDRMLVAQSIADDLTIISNDTALDAYGARRVW